MSKRGRPSHKPTTAQRRQVEELRACGFSEDDIARALAISTPTLRKHFSDELQTGSVKRRAEVVGLLFKQARKGNVSAQKTLENMTRAAALADQFMGDVPASLQAPKPPKLGKKEEAAAAAQQVAQGESVYAPPSPPKLVVNNS